MKKPSRVWIGLENPLVSIARKSCGRHSANGFIDTPFKVSNKNGLRLFRRNRTRTPALKIGWGSDLE